MLIPVMTATENVMLGVEPIRYGIFLDKAKVAKRILEISKQYDLEVDPNAYISDLPVGAQQRVEIIKVLYRQADILILDEPTAVLTPRKWKGFLKYCGPWLPTENQSFLSRINLKKCWQSRIPYQSCAAGRLWVP